MKRFRKSAIALVLALLMALQGTEPIFGLRAMGAL